MSSHCRCHQQHQGTVKRADRNFIVTHDKALAQDVANRIVEFKELNKNQIQRLGLYHVLSLIND